MLEAVLRQGAIVPLGPLPAEWKDGLVLQVVDPSEPRLDMEAWARSMNELCEDSSESDEAILRNAVEIHRREAKEQARREMGLTA